RLPSAQAPERQAVGGAGQAALLLATLAVSALDEADQAAREGADAEVAMSSGSPRCHQDAQPGPAGLGSVLPHGQRRTLFQPSRSVRLSPIENPSCEAQGTTSASRRSSEVDPRELP